MSEDNAAGLSLYSSAFVYRFRAHLAWRLPHATRGRCRIAQMRKGSLAAGAEVDQVEGLAAPEGDHDAVAAAEHAGPGARDEGRSVLVLDIVQVASLGLGGKVAMEPQAPGPLRQVLCRQLQGSGQRFCCLRLRDTEQVRMCVAECGLGNRLPRDRLPSILSPYGTR